jgi:hypothetical protein
MQKIQTGSELKEFLQAEGITVAEAARRLGTSERTMYDHFNKAQLPIAVMQRLAKGDLLREPVPEFDPDKPFVLPGKLKLNLLIKRKEYVAEFLNEHIRSNITEANHIFIVDNLEGDIIVSDGNTQDPILKGTRRKYVEDRSLFDFMCKNSNAQSILVSNENSRVVIHKMDRGGEYFLVVRTDSHDHYRFRAVELLCQKIITEIVGFIPSNPSADNANE